MHDASFGNLVLRSLNAESIQRLHLHRVQLELNHEIEFPGNSIERLFFLEEGMASMTATFRDGSQVEVGMFGYEAAIGVSALMGTKRSLNRVYMQIAGWGYTSPVEYARREFATCGKFQAVTLAYVQAQLVQAMQSAGCNAKHEIHQRLARWLLLCADRVQNQKFRMPQQFLGDMLGCTRPTVSVAAKVLKDSGLIDYTRGVISIVDTAGLEKISCECYDVIKNHLDNFAEFNSSVTAEATMPGSHGGMAGDIAAGNGRG